MLANEMRRITEEKTLELTEIFIEKLKKDINVQATNGYSALTLEAGSNVREDLVYKWLRENGFQIDRYNIISW